MSHVLLGGDQQQVSELRFLLVKWGVTVGQLALTGHVPTVQDCDAVILQGDPAEYRDACLGAMPDGSGGAAGPAAPLIFINSTPRVPRESLPESWLVLADINSDGANLRQALQSTFAAASAVRGDPDGLAEVGHDHQADTEIYLDFLGHELRSPLTAIKSSLAVLEDELGTAEGSDHYDGSRRMLAIARRNVGRLYEAVEWSQSLLAARVSHPTACPQEVSIAGVAACLQNVGEVRVSAPVRELHLRTDLGVLTTLVEQMVRAVGTACPDSRLVVEVQLDPADAGKLQVAVIADSSDLPVREIERLVRFMVVPQIVQELQGTLAPLSVDRERTMLVLTLNLLPQVLLSY